MASFVSPSNARVLVLAAGLLAAGATARAQAPARPAALNGRELSLEDALGLSGPASEAVALARVAVLRAQGEQYRARSELFPQLTGSLSYTRQLQSQYSQLFQTSAADTSS